MQALLEQREGVMTVQEGVEKERFVLGLDQNRVREQKQTVLLLDLNDVSEGNDDLDSITY
jgi:hypothetical protein